MTIFIAADHRGFEMKNQLIDYLHEKNIRIEDLGAYEKDPEDDFPDFAKKVTGAVLQKPDEFLGIVISGSGVGNTIAANRLKGIRCGLCFNEEQTAHTRENDHINVLSLPADFVSFEETKIIVDTFLATQPKREEKYLRRIKKMDDV